MYLETILGGFGIDRTAACFERMQKTREKYPDMPMIMIVPDQYSHTAERQAAERFGGTGLNGIEVLTFGRLAYRVRELAAPPDYITAAGKQMLLRRAVETTDDPDAVFALCRGKRGFMDTLSQLISEFKRYEVAADMLAERTESIENEALGRKMSVIANIYSSYEKLLSGKFSDSDDDMSMVAEYITSSDMLDGYAVWFDEFSDFLPQNYAVISAIMKKARYTGVSLCIPADEDFDPEDDTYDTCRITYGKLKKLARDAGCKTGDFCAKKGRVGEISEEIYFLLENWGGGQAVYNKPTDKISLFQGRDLYSEVEHTADEIVRLVSGGMRYRDISVLCGDAGEYAHLIEAVFSDYEIPYFSDSTSSVTTHPVIALLLSLFHILSSDWRYDDIFHYLRTGMVYEQTEKGLLPLDENMIDLLENYVLKYGVRGARQWLSDNPWSDRPSELFGEATGKEDKGGLLTDEFRRKITAPIRSFKEACAGRKTFRKVAEALYDFLEDIHLPDGLRMQIRAFYESGRDNEAEQYERVWSLLTDALDQIVEALGDERCTLDEFGKYIEDGLSCCEIRIIPTASDAVAVGSADRSRTSDVRALFLMGANSGKLPREMHTEGVLSDNDRRALEEIEILLAPDTRAKNFAEEFKLFKAVSRVREKLYVTYALADGSDNALRPARFVGELCRIFPKLARSDNALSGSGGIVPSPKAVFGRLMHHIDDDSWSAVRNWYAGEEKWSRRLERIKRSERMKAEISEEIAANIYGEKRERSITQFENYARCPYGYFLSYGLNAREREQWQIRKLDIGNLCHYLVQNYCARVSGSAKSLDEAARRWKSLSAEESCRIVDELCSEAREKTVSKLVHDTGRVESVLRRVRRSVLASVDIINKSLRNGAYIAAACEKEFSCTLTGDIKVRGIIDRVDVMEQDGKAYIRIIDYKTGSKVFDAADIYDKLDLQLAVYAASAVEIYRSGGFVPMQGEADEVFVTGMFYEKIHDTVEKEEDAGTRGKMTGIFFADTEEQVQTMDIGMADKTESEFLNVKYDRYGRLGGDIHSTEDISVLEEYASKAAKEIERDIYRGKIDINPYKRSSETACGYCPYGEICLFDSSVHSHRALLKGRGKSRLAWDRMRDIVKGEK
jgi:ATP-dependent helicase/nuclease subunit B